MHEFLPSKKRISNMLLDYPLLSALYCKKYAHRHACTSVVIVLFDCVMNIYLSQLGL